MQITITLITLIISCYTIFKTEIRMESLFDTKPKLMATIYKIIYRIVIVIVILLFGDIFITIFMHEESTLFLQKAGFLIASILFISAFHLWFIRNVVL